MSPTEPSPATTALEIAGERDTVQGKLEAKEIEIENGEEEEIPQFLVRTHTI